MQDEVNKIREQQIADLVAILMSNKSDLDPHQIGLIMSQQSISQELQDKIDDRMAKFQAKKEHDFQAIKRTRFEDEGKIDRSRSSEEEVPQSKSISMFDKVPIQHTILITPKDKVNQNSKSNNKRKTLESSDSIKYTEDFEPNESVNTSRSRSGLKVSKNDIHEEIPEEVDDGINEEYSNDFEDIPESIVRSKKHPSKFKDSTKTNNKYSGSIINEEDSIPDDIEESLLVRVKGHDDINENSSSSYRNMAKIKGTDPKNVTKPKSGMTRSKSKEKFSKNKLIERLQENNINDFIKKLTKELKPASKKSKKTSTKVQ